MNRIILILSLIIFVSYSLAAVAQHTAHEADSLLNELYENPPTNREEAKLICDDLETFYLNSGDTCNLIKTLIKQSRLERISSDFEKSKAILINAQKLHDHSACDEELQMMIYLSSTRLYNAIGLQDIADSIALLGIRSFKPSFKDKKTLIKLYMEASSGYDKPLEKSLPYLDTALQLTVKYEEPDLEQDILVSTAAAYGNNEEYEKASEYMQKALQIALQQNRIDQLGSIYNNLAGLADRDEDVLKYVDSALYYAELSNNLLDLQLYTENKAYFYSTIGEYEEGYYELWESMLLKDSLLNEQNLKAIAELEQKYESEKKAKEIQALKVDNLNAEVENLKYRRNQNRLLIGTLSLIGIAIFLIVSVVNIRRHRNKLAAKNIEIEKARQLSDELLLNILPAEIAEELKEKGSAEAKKFDMASILFTDFKGFTQTSEKLSATKLVAKINYCFKGFDEIIGKYGIEKIKTIGDAYMAAGGLPAISEESVRNTVLAALEMQKFIADRKKEIEAIGEIAFEMRVGIHTGPVVAGIVGVKKFQYDVWGDTVNTAARIESNGTVGTVNISDTTYEMIKDDPIFTFQNRGKILVKGKGKIEMYFVRLSESH